MRHVRMLGLCLIAVFAVAAVAATSASALPEWGRCEAKTGGNYTDANCTVKAKPKGSGSYEWKKGTEIGADRFTGSSEGKGGLLYTEFPECEEQVSPYNHYEATTRASCAAKGGERKNEGHGYVIECAEENSSGEAVGKDELKNIAVTFTGCKLFGTIPCQNGHAEEITTNTLKGKLGYIDKANKEVGVLLEPAKAKGTFSVFNCPGFPVDISVGVGNSKEGAAHTSTGCDQECPGATPAEEKHGGYDGIISPITPVNTMTSAYTQEYKVTEPNNCPENTVGPNNEPKLENKHIDVLELLQTNPTTHESLMFGCAAEEITNVATPNTPGEIKA